MRVDLNARLSKLVSLRTVCPDFTDFRFDYVVKVKKRRLSQRHLQQRVDWCTQYMHWTSSVWRDVVVSEESTFYILKQKNQCKMCR